MLSPQGMIAFQWVFVGFTTSFFLLRLHQMHKRNWRFRSTALKISDICVCLAWFLMVTLSVSVETYRQWQIIHWTNSTDPNVLPGFGMPMDALVVNWKLSLVMEQGYTTALWLVKWSFMAMYYPLLGQLNRPLRVLWWAILVWTVVSWALLFCMEFIWCRPIETLWSLENGCSLWQSDRGVAVGAVLNSGSDLFVILYPMLILRKFSNKRSERLGIMFLALIGLFVLAASLARVGMIVHAHKVLDVNASLEAIQISTVWGSVEQFIAVWVSCLPASKRHIARLWNSKYVKMISGRSGRSDRDSESQIATIGGGRPMVKNGKDDKKNFEKPQGLGPDEEQDLAFLSDATKSNE